MQFEIWDGQDVEGLCWYRLLERQSSGISDLEHLNIIFRYSSDPELFSHIFGNTSLSNLGARVEG
jgi:hypothetical protein